MNFAKNQLLIATVLLQIVQSSTYCTYSFSELPKEKLPYIAQATALMRNRINEKKSLSANLKNNVSPFQAPTVIHLTQRDFDSGTYRIRTPNTTIILDSDIEFEPIPGAEATRTDKPVIGWFAAMTVETDNVTIDLNGKTIQASEFFLAADIENVFADIELDNAPFSGLLFGIIGAFFPGDTEFVSAQNVVIKNGTLGRTDHWCIHGNANSNVTIEGVHAKDFPIAAIELNGVINSTIRNVKITGLEHIIRTDFMGVAASTLINYLIVLANTPNEPCFDGACQQLASLIQYVADNPQLFNRPRAVPQAAMLGISMASGFLNFTTFPATPANCDLAAFLAGGRTIENITLENISIDGITSAPEETVLIASQADGQIFNLPLYGIPVFGALTWDSAFDPQGNFAPTPLLLAQIFVINTQLCLFPDIIGAVLPPNYPAIAESIITGNEALFLANTFPVFGIALDSVQAKGTFGVRFDCSKNGTLTNCFVSNVHNIGLPGKTLADIPDGSYYEGLVIEQRYLGNDSWGYECATQADGLLTACNSCNISSLHGDIFGLDLIGDNERVTVSNCTSKKIVGFGDDTFSVVNPPATAYGMRAQNNSGPVKFIESSASQITAPRHAFGFSAEEIDGVEFTRCKVKNVTATSSKDLQTAPKNAFGFDLQGANNTLLSCISAQDIRIDGEQNAQASASVAAGIGIDDASENTTIICPTIKDIEGGAGQAVKIYDLGQNTLTQTKNCQKICKPCK